MNPQNKTVETLRPIKRLEFLEKLNQNLSTCGYRVEDVTILYEDDGQEGRVMFLFQLHSPKVPVVAVFRYERDNMDDVYFDTLGEDFVTAPAWIIDNGRFNWPTSWPMDESNLLKAIREFFCKFSGKRIIRSWALEIIESIKDGEIPDELKSVALG